MKRLTLPNASSRFGAAMGRANQLPADHSSPIKLRMERLKFVDGDYDRWGAYWGHTHGTAIYCAWGQWGIPFQDIRVFVRASNRLAAKSAVTHLLPRATFYR